MNQAESPATRDALIEAGTSLFAEHGFDGASVRAITTAAGANLGAITYHFGSKEALYDAVVEGTVGPLAQALIEAARGDAPPLERVEAVVRTHFEYASTHPALVPLMLRSILRSGMPPAQAMPGMRDLLAALAGIIRDGQADGSVRDGDPALMGFGLVSQSIHLMLMRQTLKDGLGLDFADEAMRRQVADSLARFARAGVAA